MWLHWLPDPTLRRQRPTPCLSGYNSSGWFCIPNCSNLHNYFLLYLFFYFIIQCWRICRRKSLTFASYFLTSPIQSTLEEKLPICLSSTISRGRGRCLLLTDDDVPKRYVDFCTPSKSLILDIWLRGQPHKLPPRKDFVYSLISKQLSAVIMLTMRIEKSKLSKSSSAMVTFTSIFRRWLTSVDNLERGHLRKKDRRLRDFQCLPKRDSGEWMSTSSSL